MAKRKHSTALFEVITQAKPYPRRNERASNRPGLLAGVGQWLKQGLHTSRTALSNMRSVEAVSRMESTEMQDVESSSYETQASTEPHGFEDGIHPGQTVAMAVDPQRRRISLQMSYTAAVVSGCAVLLIVTLAIIAGQRISRNSIPLLSSKSTPQLRDGPAHPEVMDLTNRLSGAPDKAGPTAPRPNNASNPADGSAPADRRTLAPPTDGDGKRYIGLNYVIIQSYHPAEEKMARDAVAFLNKEGVSCTIENGVKGYQAITVVGLQGFDKVSTPPFKAYVQRILQISAKYAVNNHSYKAFTPVAKKWDKQD